jgi:hypothetical protein
MILKRPWVLHRGTVRPLVRHSPGRAVLRRRPRPATTAPPRPRRQPSGQLGPAHHPRHPSPMPRTSEEIPGQANSREQVQTRSAAKPQTATRKRDHPAHVERRSVRESSSTVRPSPRSLTRELRVDDLHRPRHEPYVTRWRDGQMVLRWTAAGMLNAQRSFRRVKGYKQMPQLIAALRRHAHPAPARSAETVGAAA